ncbi:serine/arginine repetitive matrix protein 2 isoform X3 [Bombus vosnesenskii]|uniref:Serine/arginine repetitive matrix protein 2 isoform X3 n=1 Tax=Bombus vosnesenskii TaxID=207650 RepID=A0A6J3LP23_9HYME|nr:serine/arginine repetitive matrix protein 2 isoform X3 [Bombus vosnesenskii]
MVVGEASIHNIMGGMESTGGVRLHNHKRKLKQRFDIIKKLGQGTYGKVQLGINKETGQEVAIKTIKKCKIETEADLIRIRREIQIMSSVQHPNIIHIYEVFENREKMVLVMEYAAGGELYDYLSERKVLTEHEARRIFRQIATAVFYCHKHKICHRDLKLENILLDQVGNAKIADFGLSNVFDEQRLLNTFCGSPLYASPEIVKGTPYHGPEVDCWSLGVLLYTLVYGAMPFDGSNFKRLVKQISQSDYFEPKKPSPASPLIKDMLTVCPARRADIERICTHWWVNEGYEQNCLDIAEDLAAQTPVRLDLLLSLVPQSASAEKLVVGDQQPAAADVPNNVSSETLIPTRCHSVGSLMELDQSGSDRRIRRELIEEEQRTAPIGGDAKRKLETTPSMDETAAADAKRKERSRRKEKRDEPEARTYKSASRHHSAPIPNSITEEAMEVDPMVTVPISKTVDLNKIESTAACLELIKECSERSPSKERSKTPMIHEPEQRPLAVDESRRISSEDRAVANHDEERSPDERQAQSLDDGHRDESSSMTKRSEMALDQTIACSATPVFEPSNEKTLSGNERFERTSSTAGQEESINLEATQREFKKLKEKALSLDSELSNEPRDAAAKTFERRRSKIFETAEKFNQMASTVENEKPKKIFIPGVNVGGAKRVFERKASLSSIGAPPPTKCVASKMIIDVPTTDTKKNENSNDKSKPTRVEREEREEQEQPEENEEDEKKKEEAKKRAIDIISGAIGKPPMQRRINGSPPVSPSSQEPKKLASKISVSTNDSRSTAQSLTTTPTETNFSFDEKTAVGDGRATISTEAFDDDDGDNDDDEPEEPKMSSKMEITLKSATLPRPRKTSKAEISVTSAKPYKVQAPFAFKSELEAKIDAFQPQKLRTQRSEVAFPVAAAVPQTNRSSSLEPESRPRSGAPKERIIPIQMEADHRQSRHSSTTPPPSKPPPMPQRSVSQRSGSLSRQSTADSDTDSALGSTVGPEPIRKSPREYIIPIAVEGGGYVTPRSGSVEPESKTGGTPSSANVPRSRFGRPRRMSSLLSDASEDESPFSSLHRDSEDLLQRHMHRLRSSRPSRQPPEHVDSLSSGEDDDDDGFELLTAENLFSTLLSRVRSLTQRLNVDDNRTTGFPSSRLFGRLGSNSSQALWGLNKPLSSYQTYVETRTVTTRLSESQFRHSLGREGDILSRKDCANTSNPGTPSSPGSHGNPSRETVFDVGSNTLPRDKVAREDVEAEATRTKKETQESLEQSFTPSLTRRLGRTLIEQTRRSLTRSPSVSREGRARSAERDASDAAAASSSSSAATAAVDRSVSTVSDQSEYKHRSASDRRAIRRTNSLLESATGSLASPRRTVAGLFDDEDDLADHRHLHGRSSFFSTFPRDTVARGNLGRWYNETGGGRASTGRLRKDSFRSYRTDKIQEETSDDAFAGDRSGSISEYASTSACDSNTNPLDDDASPTESRANNAVDYKPAYKTDPTSSNLENRLLAAENLIRESKLKNLGSAGGVNLTSSYRDADKCEKRSLISMAETTGAAATSKRRTCIPSLRLRSGSLTREPSAAVDRRKSLADSQDVANLVARTLVPERSLLSKFFKSAAGRSENEPTRDKEKETDAEKEKEKPQKSKQRRISRFLRPDFFDTPREESRYAKEKEAQKAAENERRKSRFIKRKSENRDAAAVSKTTVPTTTSREGSVETEKKREKELKNEINSRRRDRCSRERETATETTESVEGSRNGFLHSLEKKLESLRCNDEQRASGREKTTVKSTASDERTIGNEASRERSAPPVDRRLSSGSNERVTLERASSSVEDLSRPKNPKRNSPKSRVSSVLGLFKTVDPKQLANGARSQTTILGKLKKSPPKVLADLTSVEDATTVAPTVGSKIPTKLVANADAKSTKKIGETNKSDKPEKRVSSCESSRRFSSKEGPKQDGTPSTAKERSASREKESAGERGGSGNWNRDADQGSTDTRREKPNDDEKRSTEKRSVAIAGNRGNKRANRCSLENGASSTEPSRSENAEKKTGKPTKKTCETSESNDSDGVKKKRIVRVAKKVVKKSTVSGGGTGDKSIDKSNDKSGDADKMSDGKEKSAKPRTKKKVAGICDKSSVETKVAAASAKAGNAEENGLGTESGDKSEERAANDHSEEETVETETNNDDEPAKIQRETQRPNRNNLKLDLSKIPQHSFRNATPKRDSPKSDSPSSTTTNQDLPGKLMECLSKVTHRASITGNKVIVDKPLRARDVAELKREVTECAKIIESHAESAVNAAQGPPEERKSSAIPSQVSTENDRPITSATTAVTGADYPNDVLSPIDDPESFDSWSISSAELSHARPDLHSPTSPSHSLYARNDNSDNSESVIDRIRRRSFYSRFNDRRRPSLTAPPPGVALPGSATLPRKFSFSGHREHRDRGRYATGYAGLASAVTSKTGGSGGGGSSSSGNRYATDKRYGFYSEDGIATIDRRNRSLDRAARYSDTGYVTDLKSPTEHPVVLSSSYDPLRRYLRSPTFDLFDASRSRYHSADFTADPDLTTVYRPSACSLSNDSVSLGYSSLPRKYAIGLAEPKTVQYYEELLSPSTADYSPSRRSPTCSEYPTRCENGYYNGNSDVRANAAKRKTCTENARTLELYEDTDPASAASCDERSTEQRRSKGERTTQTKHSLSTSADTTSRCANDHS